MLRLETLPSVEAAPDLRAEADLATEYLRPFFARAGKASPQALRLVAGKVDGSDSPEAYELVVDPREGVRILGNSAAGVFHGLQSLRSLLPVAAAPKGLALQAMRVVDAPRFAYRGLMLDVARNFQPKATVLRALDLMARYKLNALHLHLTDDEGWRVEIEGLPELTSVGARRGHTLDSSTHLPPAWGSGPDGGYKVVLCPVSNLYFDMAANTNPEEPGLHWGGYVDIDKPFEFIPFDSYRNVHEDSNGNPLDRAVFIGKDRLTDYGRSNILGLQGNLFSETLSAEGRLDYMLMPKLLGLAERAWAPDPAWALEKDDAKSAALYREAWSEFVGVLGKRELPRLDRESPAVTYRIPTPGLRVVEAQVRASLRIPGFVMRYTTDGSEPTLRSLKLRGPLSATGLVRVAAFDTRGRKGYTATISAR